MTDNKLKVAGELIADLKRKSEDKRIPESARLCFFWAMYGMEELLNKLSTHHPKT